MRMTGTKGKKLGTVLVLACVLLFAVSCAGGAGGKAQEGQGGEDAAGGEPGLAEAMENLIVVGVSQVGSESVWRTANTESIQQVFTQENGYFLLFENGRQKQENQIKAIRTFIAQKVDLIGFVPIVETGWDNILREAKRAGIPVMIMDRDLKVSDDSLYVAKIGTDSVAEGRKQFTWMDEYITKIDRKPRNGGDKINIVILEGTVGASAAVGRSKGFNEALEASPNKDRYNILASQTGDFTRAKGKEVMESFLKSYGNDIDVLISQNDDMALGAIQAIEAAGLKPAQDIIIIGADADVPL